MCFLRGVPFRGLWTVEGNAGSVPLFDCFGLGQFSALVPGECFVYRSSQHRVCAQFRDRERGSVTGATVRLYCSR